jgi:hypothetical protein
MSAQPRLELVTSEDALYDEVVSPELVLVDPELAERARARLELPQSTSFVVARPLVPRAVPPPEVVPLRPAVRTDAEPEPLVVELPQAPTPIPLVAEAVVAEPPAPVELPAPAESPAATVVGPPPQVAAPPASPPPSSSAIRNLRLVAVGVVLGLFGGVFAADVWMPPEASELAAAPTVPPTTTGKRASKPPTPTSTRPSKAKRPAERPATTPQPAGPAFVWVAVPGASRYEVVFERGGKIVYRATTTRTRLQLPVSWRFQGATYRLQPGRYHWTVWPLVKGKRGQAVVSSDYTA